MSYHTWTVDGYGICVDDIATTTERLLQLIRLAPEFYAEYLEWAEYQGGEGEPVEEADPMELLEWEDGCGNKGLAAIMQAVIYENENIRLYVADDSNGADYLLFEPMYPWSKRSTEEDALTEESLAELIGRYVRVLTDKPVKVCYCSVENGG